MKTVLIAERFSGKAWRPYCPIPSAKWLQTSLQFGAFRRGIGASRLCQLGCKYDGAMNLLPPDQPSEIWDGVLAETVAEFITRQPWRLLFLCGPRVASAFNVVWSEYGDSAHVAPNMLAVVIPNPVSRGGWWRDPRKIEAIQRRIGVAKREATRRPPTAVSYYQSAHG